MNKKEYLDILDENGNALGRIKERARVHWDGDWHRTVHVWIANGRGEIMIQKRGPRKYIHPEKWDVSCAGHVVSGDSSRQAAIREAKEELGLSISPLELRFLGTVRETFTDGNVHDNEIIEIFLVQRDIRPNDCILQKDEVSDVGCISVEELKRRIGRNDAELVHHREEFKKLFAFLDAQSALK